MKIHKLMTSFLFCLLFVVTINAQGIVYAQSCYDSDGLDFYTKGLVEFDGKFYHDNCVNEEVLIEGYCEGNYFKTTTYYCPSSCSNGACTETLPPTSKPESSSKVEVYPDLYFELETHDTHISFSYQNSFDEIKVEDDKVWFDEHWISVRLANIVVTDWFKTDGLVLDFTLVPIGTSSETKFYCNYKGEPTRVYLNDGEFTGWSYDTYTKILTLNVYHNYQDMEVTIEWPESATTIYIPEPTTSTTVRRGGGGGGGNPWMRNVHLGIFEFPLYILIIPIIILIAIFAVFKLFAERIKYD